MTQLDWSKVKVETGMPTTTQSETVPLRNGYMYRSVLMFSVFSILADKSARLRSTLRLQHLQQASHHKMCFGQRFVSSQLIFIGSSDSTSTTYKNSFLVWWWHWIGVQGWRNNASKESGNPCTLAEICLRTVWCRCMSANSSCTDSW